LAGYPCYFNGGELDPSYLDAYAREIANSFGGTNPKLTRTQMRGFFGDVKRVETRLRASEDFAVAKERLLQLKAMAYERAKKRKVPDEFQRFIEKNVDATIDDRTFGAFVKHFEAVVAYSEGKLDQR
jgi:CRISPR-associated protein Csm2